jgi:hypothetical protein
MRRTLLAIAGLLLFAACPAVRAQQPGAECCSTYPIYLCRPGYLGYPAPPRDLALFENCTGCNHLSNGSATACGQITPNPYSCCFYGVTLSNYALLTPSHAPVWSTPSHLPPVPVVPVPPRELDKKTPAPK